MDATPALSRRPSDGAQPSSPSNPNWQTLDHAWGHHLATHPETPHRWLLLQTIATSMMRRHILSMLEVQPGWRTLDVGTGFGPIPMELATLGAVEAFGIDVDAAVLQVAERVRREVDGHDGFEAGSRVTFSVGDAHELPQNDRSIDLVTARFVFQHLRDHSRVVTEMARVVKRGGYACLIDVDEGLSAAYPEPSPAYRTLADAVSAMQAACGGGRDVGRKLPALLDIGGFDIRAVLALPSAAYRSSMPSDPGRAVLIDRFLEQRSALIEGEFLEPEQFDRALAQFSSERITAECVVETHLAVIGQRR